jgi:putative endopeptidase
VLRNWWSDEDTAAFKRLGDRLAAQYDAFEPLPGLHVNGRLTLGENIGDLSGVTVALEAYKLSLHGQAAPVIEGLTGEQRFFLAYAQVWRETQREESLRNLVTANPHSPPQYRVNGIVRNVDAWYEAFNVRPGEKLYLAPQERVRIW